MARSDLLRSICELSGSIDVRDTGSGWPGLVEVDIQGRSQSVALHVSNVSAHARKDYERRFQNPGNRRPVSAPLGYLPVLCGLARYQDTPVLVAINGASRIGREARFSILFNASILQNAALRGWSEYTSGTGEVITAMVPRLLPAYIDALIHDVSLDVSGVQEAASAFELPNNDDENAAERTRTLVARMVRRASFGREVCSAYDNKCAMCGLSLNVLEGAHILPVGFPQATDEVWNGLALCRNHHRLFDRHQIWVSPQNKSVHFHPEVLDSLQNEPNTNFVENTLEQVSMPRRAVHRPRVEMFEARYQSAAAEYDWVE